MHRHALNLVSEASPRALARPRASTAQSGPHWIQCAGRGVHVRYATIKVLPTVALPLSDRRRFDYRRAHLEGDRGERIVYFILRRPVRTCVRSKAKTLALASAPAAPRLRKREQRPSPVRNGRLQRAANVDEREAPGLVKLLDTPLGAKVDHEALEGPHGPH